jgi:hypothetical protein
METELGKERSQSGATDQLQVTAETHIANDNTIYTSEIASKISECSNDTINPNDINTYLNMLCGDSPVPTNDIQLDIESKFVTVI